MTRSLLNDSNLPLKYWDYAAPHAVHLLNKLVIGSLEKPPIEFVFQTQKRFKYEYIFCQGVYYMKDKISNKLAATENPGKYLGHSSESGKAYVLDNISKKIIVTRNIRSKNNSYAIIKRIQLAANKEDKNKKSLRQRFEDIRNEPSNETSDSWDDHFVRRTTKKTSKPVRFHPGITSNFINGKRMKQLNIDPVDIFKVNQLKANTVPSSYFKALNSAEKDHWEAAYMKEVNKFSSITSCKKIQRDRIPKDAKIYRLVELFS
eukprot:snap_masked-scaffold_3-processed-gene-18.13-mRNA-1 protein AED:0.88 eAED:0.88 QI:0/-1/0/1/-1/1/1/0/260